MIPKARKPLSPDVDSTLRYSLFEATNKLIALLTIKLQYPLYLILPIFLLTPEISAYYNF